MLNTSRLSLREFVLNHQSNIKNGINIIEASAKLDISRQSYKTRLNKINQFLSNTGYETLKPNWGRSFTFQSELRDLISEGVITKKEELTEAN